MLKVKNNKVIGPISLSIEEMSVATFDRLMMQGDFNANCLVLSNEADPLPEPLKIYPNPTVSEINIHTNQSIQQVVIYNALGNELYRQSNINQQQVTLPTSQLAAGLYLVEIKTDQHKPIVRRFYK